MTEETAPPYDPARHGLQLVPLSVVIAVDNGMRCLEDCLEALRAQDPSGQAEIIVAGEPSCFVRTPTAGRFPSVRYLEAPSAILVPHLWALGAYQSRGAVVAFTTADFVPAASWIEQILAHHTSSHAGIGGAIDSTPDAKLAHWAIYFCRYGAYMPPFAPHLVSQIAGDNAVYKRFVLEEMPAVESQGFWEYEVNERLRAGGHTLLLTPAIRVRFASSPGVASFCRQRLAHGRRFGAERVAFAPGRRGIYIAAAPLVPLILLAKMTRRVIAKKDYAVKFVQSLPFTLLFTVCWSWGEFLGYLLGTRGAARHPTGKDP